MLYNATCLHEVNQSAKVALLPHSPSPVPSSSPMDQWYSNQCYVGQRDCPMMGSPDSSASTSLVSTPSGSPLSKASQELGAKDTKEVLNSVLGVRKTWKTFRDGETVWPPDLEQALIEGLERHKPEDCRETRMLGRFPRRNKFIANYIYAKTGKRRSAKQVGSRLQQMRETCSEAGLLHLLSPFRHPAPLNVHDSAQSAPTAGSSPRASYEDPKFGCRRTTIHIALIPDEDRHSPLPVCSPIPDDELSSGDEVLQSSPTPRRLRDIDPKVAFSTKTPVSAKSYFTVYSAGLVLYSETVPLVLMKEQSVNSDRFLYNTDLVPGYWRTILDSPDPTRFTITQEVVHKDRSAGPVLPGRLPHTLPQTVMPLLDPLSTSITTLTSAALIPDIIPAFVPKAALTVLLPSGALSLGSEIPISETVAPPSIGIVAVPEDAEVGADGLIESHAKYTLVMFDPDAPSAASPTSRNFRHWVITGLVPSSDPLSPAEQTAEAANAYRPPGPPKGSGLHRYTFVLYREPPSFVLPEDASELDPSIEARRRWDPVKFGSMNGLQMVAAAFYLVRSED
ncbi:unnamed protein product [Mycena citricolor]|uniref:TEA domain-containing protein n=1 Tax=Mycena citricolor TaxID=2018698 RepID=A0AAD2K891_9AGAR|nr:unnamed protein product [Mycena citricolor]